MPRTRASRPSPPVSATDFEVGHTSRGNDGNTYVVVRAGKSQRWVPLKDDHGAVASAAHDPRSKSKAKSRSTHKQMSAAEFEARHSDATKRVVTVDNGGRPFVVYLVPKKHRTDDAFWRELQGTPGAESGPGKAYVFVNNGKDDDDHDDEKKGGAVRIPFNEKLKRELSRRFYLLRVIPYKNAFVGHDSEELREFARWESAKQSAWKRRFGLANPPSVWYYGGNSVLLQTAPRTYVHVGERIFQFRTPGDKVMTFVSDMGNSAVPYPYAVGQKRVYYMIGTTLYNDPRPESVKNHPVSAPITPENRDFTSPLSDEHEDPYEWLWRSKVKSSSKVINLERGPASKKAGVRLLEGYRELFPRLF